MIVFALCCHMLTVGRGASCSTGLGAGAFASSFDAEPSLRPLPFLGLEVDPEACGLSSHVVSVEVAGVEEASSPLLLDVIEAPISGDVTLEAVEAVLLSPLVTLFLSEASREEV